MEDVCKGRLQDYRYKYLEKDKKGNWSLEILLIFGLWKEMNNKNYFLREIYFYVLGKTDEISEVVSCEVNKKSCHYILNYVFNFA